MRLIVSSLLVVSALAVAACTDAPTAAKEAAISTADIASISAEGENNGLLGQARGATAKYQRVEVAIADGYVSTVDCVAIPSGAMGVHYVNPSLMMDAIADAEKPEALVYEPQANGELKLVALEYIVLQGPWQASGQQGIPSLFGQQFDVGVGPMGPWYTLHAWTWRQNPLGIFAPFNPKASCPSSAPANAAAQGHAH